jgi:hypothetical protein
VKKPLTSLTTLIGARQQTFTTSSIPGGTSRRLPQQNSHHAARWGRRARDCFPPVRAGPLPSSRSPPRRVTDRRTRQTDGWQMCDTPTYGAASRMADVRYTDIRRGEPADVRYTLHPVGGDDFRHRPLI